jgi:predicted alpha/beta-hydrolase family hydrolase
MVNSPFLIDGPPDAAVTLLLAHGAGAPMDSAWMSAAARALAERGMRVARFEFGYMAARRTAATRKPPPRAEALMTEFIAARDALDVTGPVIIGGKSMGGRVASMVADHLHRAGRVAGLVCLGYPFHPPGRPERTRTAHLEALAVPALIVQGTRDPFGTREDVAAYALPPTIEMLWLAAGDHEFRPRQESAATAAGHLRAWTEHAAAWSAALTRRGIARP